MKETFDEYKNTIESNLMNLSYLYSGDVIAQKKDTYKENINHSKVSPSVIINSIEQIYNESIKEMLIKSKGTQIVSFDFDKVDKNGKWLIGILDNIRIKDFSSKYIFTNIGVLSRLGITADNKNKPFPSHFYSVKSDIYVNDLIEYSDNEIVVYLVDRPIQSLVYTIQNMSYIISDKNHTIEYDFYHCDYKSYKVIIKDISKYRNDRIDSILNTS
jgi:hypothetical protein